MSIKHYTQELQDEALAIALEAKAIRVCGRHDEQYDADEPEYNSRAYAIATNRIKRGEFVGNREDLLDAIKNVIDSAAFACSGCEHERYQ